VLKGAHPVVTRDASGGEIRRQVGERAHRRCVSRLFGLERHRELCVRITLHNQCVVESVPGTEPTPNHGHVDRRCRVEVRGQTFEGGEPLLVGSRRRLVSRE